MFGFKATLSGTEALLRGLQVLATPSLLLFIGLLLLLPRIRWLKRTGSRAGNKRPTKLPLFGYALSVPASHPWKTFAEWGKTLGEFSSHAPLIGAVTHQSHHAGGILPLTVLGSTLIVINSAEVARDTMDKRGAIYSDRRRSVVLDM